MNLFRSREGALADADAKTQLTTLGSQTAPGPLLVPGDAKFLKAAHVAVITSFEAADNYSFLVRLEGPGIQRGVFNFAAGSGGVPVATGGSASVNAVRIPINIPVIAGQEVLVFAENVQGDMGTHQAAVTLEFGSEAGPEGETLGEITVEGEITAVDTLTRLTAQGSVTAPSRLTPPNAKILKRLIYSVAHDGQADGEVNFIVRLGGDAIRGGEQTLVLGGGSRIAVQTGSDAAPNVMAPRVIDNLDLEVNPGETLDISAEMAGVDVGTAGIVVTAIFA
jgi:hypothetical protein